MQTPGIWPNGLPSSHFLENGESHFEHYLRTRNDKPVARITKSVDPYAKPAKKVAQPRSSDKKERARAIFLANNTESNNNIAKIIATELDITYSNAYYYVTRVFKK